MKVSQRMPPGYLLPLSVSACVAVQTMGAAQAQSRDFDNAPAFEPSRVIGGEAVKTCGFPSVVSLDRGGMGCTATLVHPKLIFTAAHCFMMGSHPKTVHFGERRGSRSKTVKVEKCKEHPSWKKTKEVGGTDIAYCVLAEEVNDVPITPILMGCEIEVLKAGAPVVIAGFGLTRPPWSSQEQEPTSRRDGVKHWVETRYIETIQGELKAAVVGSKGKQGCKGDSGGPVFVKLPEDKFGKDAGWRVFGVTSGQRGDAPQCTTGAGTYAMMHEWIATVEKESGLDLTPCFDADGSWNPGPDCHSAPLELASTAAGSWPGSCESGPLSGKITTCAGDSGGEESEGEASSAGSDSSQPSDQESDSASESQPEDSSDSGSSDVTQEPKDSAQSKGSKKQEDPKSGTSQSEDAKQQSASKGEEGGGGCRMQSSAPEPYFGLLLLGCWARRRKKS